MTSHILESHQSDSLKTQMIVCPTRSTSNVKQRGGKKNGKRQSSEDRTADEEEVMEIKLIKPVKT